VHPRIRVSIFLFFNSSRYSSRIISVALESSHPSSASGQEAGTVLERL